MLPIGLPAAVIKRDDKILDQAGCLVKHKCNGRTKLRLVTSQETINLRLNAKFFGVLKWQEDPNSTAKEIEFKVKSRVVESDGETAFYPIKLNKKLKKKLNPKAQELNRNFAFNDSSTFHVITCDNEIIEASIDRVDLNTISMKLFTLPEPQLQGCPIYDESMKLVGLVKSKMLGEIWNVSWIHLKAGMHSVFIFFISF